jgi:hypothetical protein
MLHLSLSGKKAGVGEARAQDAASLFQNRTQTKTGEEIMGWLQDNPPKCSVTSKEHAQGILESLRVVPGALDAEEMRLLGECIGFLSGLAYGEKERDKLQTELGAQDAEIIVLKAELSSVKRKAEGLEMYVSHRATCPWSNGLDGSPALDHCSCGLNAVLATWNEGNPK